MELEKHTGFPFPLGATWDGKGVNFSIFSDNATGVEVCLFDKEDDTEAAACIAMTDRTYSVWHVYIPGIKPCQLYGFRVYGPYTPEEGLRFNPHKLLIDPNAKAISGILNWHDSLFGYDVESEEKDLKMSETDSAPYIPKAIVVNNDFDWEDDKPLKIPYQNTIIYETHVKGFTYLNPDIPEEIRGTYAAISHPASIKYLLELGITAIELMPVHHFVTDRHLKEKGLVNYWGYNTINFFSPDIRYASSGNCGGQINEFKQMVKDLHKAGIEVILDVVYNHTAEGNELGPTLSLRGIDNASYYRLQEEKRYYMDYTGTGNTLNTVQPNVLRMIMDSLRYWILDMHVDGFRFDLASTLARELHEVDRLGSFFDIIHQDPIISQVKLIAEPWDVGEGGYQVGKFPPGWAEWNGMFRDCIRDYWRGADSMLAEFAGRFTGSADLYRDDRYPTASINFVTAHDGFTMRDLVSYNDKHNDANGEDNKDGESHNRSWNCGVEGDTEDPDILALRKKQVRNFMATLFLSQGVPMLLAGDEIGRTQKGNNNAYCQDNEISWVDWEHKDEELLAFTQKLIRLRRDHPVFCRSRWFKGERVKDSGAAPDIAWFLPEGTEMNDENWSHDFAKSLAVFLNGRGLRTHTYDQKPITDDSFYIIFNAHFDPLTFCFPGAIYGKEWVKVIDTARDETDDNNIIYGPQKDIIVEGRSMIVLKQKKRTMKELSTKHRTIGLNLNNEAAGIRLWAPFAEQVTVHNESKGIIIPLQKEETGYWHNPAPGIDDGDLYRFSINNGELLPDPASLWQPKGVHGPSGAVSLDFDWTDQQWRNPELGDYIIYEVHTGTFSSTGTFEGIRERLDHLLNLGITAIELMPVAQFPGHRNWGYDGVYPFAVQESYGGAKALQQLVNDCHARGLAVILDVVYNHLGPEGNYFSAYGPYFTDKYKTPWGSAINFDDDYCDPVRRFFIENALMWLRDFHIDALRLDAVHAIRDHSPKHIVQEMNEAVAQYNESAGSNKYLILETDLNDSRFIKPSSEGGFDVKAQWCDEFHHSLRVAAGQERVGYYADFDGVSDLALSLQQGYVYTGQYSPQRHRNFGTSTDGISGDHFIVFAQNHDQVGNRMLGERTGELLDLERQKLLATVVLTAPFVPLLFMGEEWGAKTPFHYFTDHSDTDLIAAVEQGRKQEFASFQQQGEPALANDEATFLRSKLDWHDLETTDHKIMLEYYKQLIRLRKTHTALHHYDRSAVAVLAEADKGMIVLQRCYKEQHIYCLFNFSDEEREVKLHEDVFPLQVLLSSSDKRWQGPEDSYLHYDHQTHLTVQPHAAILLANYHVPA